MQPQWVLEFLRSLGNRTAEELAFLQEGLNLRMEDVMQMLSPYQKGNSPRLELAEIESYLEPKHSPFIHQLTAFALWRLELPIQPFVEKLTFYLEKYSLEARSLKITETLAKSLLLSQPRLDEAQWSRVEKAIKNLEPFVTSAAYSTLKRVWASKSA
jgi:hypothetical protein